MRLMESSGGKSNMKDGDAHKFAATSGEATNSLLFGGIQDCDYFRVNFFWMVVKKISPEK